MAYVHIDILKILIEDLFFHHPSLKERVTNVSFVLDGTHDLVHIVYDTKWGQVRTPLLGSVIISLLKFPDIYSETLESLNDTLTNDINTLEFHALIEEAIQ